MEIIKTLGFLMVAFVIISVPSQFSIVNTLNKKGYNASVFMFLFSNLRKYKKIMNSENDSVIKKKMKITFYLYVIPVIISISCFISIILTINFIR